jgi:hypothetical protein
MLFKDDACSPERRKMDALFLLFMRADACATADDSLLLASREELPPALPYAIDK